MASFIRDVAKSSIDNDGIPTSEVAQQVLDAIQRDQFWVLTHEDMKPAVTVRFDRAIHGVNPPGIGQ
jgi:hemolysin-activating ACP:hemolysin acyltransferase